MNSSTSAMIERRRQNAFASIWREDLDTVFVDVAEYYDKANTYASLGLLPKWQRRFIDGMILKPGDKVLDVCAGQNIVGIAMLKKQPGLDIHAADQSVSMQEEGKKVAESEGYSIDSHICDVHELPFPDNSFDVVTLQYASRHLRVADAFAEIKRVLKPGGRFYHCDMQRPPNTLIEKAYLFYLKWALTMLAKFFTTGSPTKEIEYFLNAIHLFYSHEELSDLLSELGFTQVKAQPIMFGAVALHEAMKP